MDINCIDLKSILYFQRKNYLLIIFFNFINNQLSIICKLYACILSLSIHSFLKKDRINNNIPHIKNLFNYFNLFIHIMANF